MSLHILRDNGFNPKSILDIGCNVGQFFHLCQNTWGDSFDAFLIDGNEHIEEDIQKLGVPYKVCVLSDEIKEIDWYSTKVNLKNTGDSYYRENTDFYSDDNLIVSKKVTTTLSDMFADAQFDLIKMDTQGSEIDIIKGGVNLCKKAKYIILEVALVNYNEGAPLNDDVIEFMKTINFIAESRIGAIIRDGTVLQQDILFKNENI